MAESLTPANIQQLTEIGQAAVGPARPGLDWSPDGRWLALTREDASTGMAYLALFDAQSLTAADLPAPIQASHVAFSPDGRFLAVSFYRDLEDHVQIWETARLFQPDAAPFSSYTGNFGGIQGLTFSPDNRLLALAVSAAQGSLVPLIEVETGQVRHMLKVSYQGTHAPLVENVAFSPDGSLVGAVTYGGIIQVWRVADGSLIVSATTGVTQPNQIAFLSPDRFVTNGYPTAIVWGLDGKPLIGLTDAADLWTLDVAPEGGLVAGAKAEQISFWDATDGALLRSIAAPAKVQILRFGPGGRLALLDEADTLQLWGLGAGEGQGTPTDRYTAVWQQLGGAEGQLGPAVSDIVANTFVFQHFERGLMFRDYLFRQDPQSPQILILVYGDNPQSGYEWMMLDDDWQAGQPEFPCAEAQPPLGPRRSFGDWWCNESYVQGQVGAPLEAEYEEAASYQEFRAGILFWSPRDGGVYALLNSGPWYFYPDR
ncbi:MAG TPA: hypothetical protein ENJ31_00950 [Anaerolineae bacterium]|nr:hypothetical protein [Anaerolineae bacterium]